MHDRSQHGRGRKNAVARTPIEEAWDARAREFGGIPAYLAVGGAESGLACVVLMIEGDQRGMLKIMLVDELGKGRQMFFAPKADIEQACAAAMMKDDNHGDDKT